MPQVIQCHSEDHGIIMVDIDFTKLVSTTNMG